MGTLGCGLRTAGERECGAVRCALVITASWIASALAVQAQPAPGLRHVGSIAGGEFTLDFPVPAETLSVDVGPTPVACELDADRRRARCQVPTTLGPGFWPADAEFSAAGQYFRLRTIVELRVPAIVSATPSWVPPGAMIELEMEGPLPTGEPVELLIRGEGYERVVLPKLVRSARLRARLPDGEMPEAPTLQLRVRDTESEPFRGLLVNRWLSFALAYGEWVGPGLAIGCAAAVAIIFLQPARRRAIAPRL